MATKLTKAFAEFVGGRGFLIANEDEISQQPSEDYKLARQISHENQADEGLLVMETVRDGLCFVHGCTSGRGFVRVAVWVRQGRRDGGERTGAIMRPVGRKNEALGVFGLGGIRV